MSEKEIVDLICHRPKAYLDISKSYNFHPKNKFQRGEQIYFSQITVLEFERSRRYLKPSIQVYLRDVDGDTATATIYGQKHKDAFSTSRTVSFFGTVSTVSPLSLVNIIMVHPVGYHKFYPLYRTTKAEVRHGLMRLKHDFNLEQLIPSLPCLRESFLDLHFPRAQSLQELNTKLELAITNISIEEIISHISQSYGWMQKDIQIPEALKIEREMWHRFRKSLPFTLTSSQIEVIEEIYNEFELAKPMRRLIQGDVGSGKTVVCAALALQIFYNSQSTLILAPSSILVKQHVAKIQEYLAHFNIPIFYILGSRSLKANREKMQNIISKAPCIILATDFVSVEQIKSQIGLVIVDEQHRYGHKKRAAYLRGSTHRLVMTSATPLPRSLQLSLNNYLEFNMLEGKPAASSDIKSYILPHYQLYGLVQKLHALLNKGDQVLWVCPRLRSQDSANVNYSYNWIVKHFPHLKVNYISGKMSELDKTSALKEFAEGKTQILVGTSILEVGIDIPNATVMIVEDAAHFGTASLHQIRGRVGRGNKQGYCFFVYSPHSTTYQGRLRLEHLRGSTQGYDLAHKDLEARGCGNFLGIQQAGRGRLRFVPWEQVPQILEKALPIYERLTSEVEILEQLQKRWCR